MKKIYLIALLLSCTIGFANAQHYSLFNTRSLLDGFENPAIRTFTLDSSRMYASNFFFPTLSLSAANKGSAETVMRQLFNEGILDTRTLPIGTGARNQVFENTNIYLLTFKIFSHY